MGKSVRGEDVRGEGEAEGRRGRKVGGDGGRH